MIKHKLKFETAEALHDFCELLKYYAGNSFASCEDDEIRRLVIYSILHRHSKHFFFYPPKCAINLHPHEVAALYKSIMNNDASQAMIHRERYLLNNLGLEQAYMQIEDKMK